MDPGQGGPGAKRPGQGGTGEKKTFGKVAGSRRDCAMWHRSRENGKDCIRARFGDRFPERDVNKCILMIFCGYCSG